MWPLWLHRKYPDVFMVTLPCLIWWCFAADAGCCAGWQRCREALASLKGCPTRNLTHPDQAGLLLALFGGVRKAPGGEGEMALRGDAHILLVGDPGLGKSQLLQVGVVWLGGRHALGGEGDQVCAHAKWGWNGLARLPSLTYEQQCAQCVEPCAHSDLPPRTCRQRLLPRRAASTFAATPAPQQG